MIYLYVHDYIDNVQRKKQVVFFPPKFGCIPVAMCFTLLFIREQNKKYASHLHVCSLFLNSHPLPTFIIHVPLLVIFNFLPIFFAKKCIIENAHWLSIHSIELTK